MKVHALVFFSLFAFSHSSIALAEDGLVRRVISVNEFSIVEKNQAHINNSLTCPLSDMSTSLTLSEVMDRAFCNNPQTHQRWAEVMQRVELVSIDKSAFLPSVTATAGLSKSNTSTNVAGYPQFSYNTRPTAKTLSINGSWILFDSGLRNANLEHSRQLLAVAQAMQDATLQEIFLSTSEDFYKLLSAQGKVGVATDARRSAEENLVVSDAKYQAGVGTLAEKLQAQTNLAQAILNLVKVNGEVRNLQGVLSVAIGMPINAKITLSADNVTPPLQEFMQSVEALIDEAKRSHPTLTAGRAQLRAAIANVTSTQAEGRPSIRLTTSLEHDAQFGQSPANTNETPSSSVNRNNSIGVYVNIPIFDGFARSHRVQAAQMQVEASRADLRLSEDKISLDIWKNYQSVLSEMETLKATDDLISSAKQSADVAFGRYKAGVGSLLDLLNMQSALASARQQRVQTLSDFCIAKLRLASSLGSLH